MAHSAARWRNTLLLVLLSFVIVIPAAFADNWKTWIDVAYGADEKQRIDVYASNAPIANAPIIAMVHGGGWRHGDKSYSRVVDNKVAHWVNQGFIFVSINYRMLPDADVPTQAGDVAAAIAYIQHHASLWGGNAQQLIVMGHSAGAHLVALLSANPAIGAAKELAPWKGTVVLDSAAMNVPAVMERRHLGLYDDAFGLNENYWRSNSPIHNLTKQAIPMMLVCSTKRRDKPCDQASEFAAQAAQFGIPVTINPQNRTHGEINSELGERGTYTQAVDDFIRSRLAP